MSTRENRVPNTIFIDELERLMNERGISLDSLQEMLGADYSQTCKIKRGLQPMSENRMLILKEKLMLPDSEFKRLEQANRYNVYRYTIDARDLTACQRELVMWLEDNVKSLNNEACVKAKSGLCGLLFDW